MMVRDDPAYAVFDRVKIRTPVEIRFQETGDRNVVLTLPPNYVGEVVKDAIPKVLEGYVYDVRFLIPIGGPVVPQEGVFPGCVTIEVTVPEVDEYELEYVE